MADRFLPAMILVGVAAAAVGAVVTFAVMRAPAAAPTTSATATPATIEGKPNFSGIWQANNEANWDLQAHAARPAAVTQQGIYPYDYARVPAAPVLALGAAGAVPGSLGVVQGDGEIPYKPEALARKQENAANWIDRDPELKCYLPGLPRAMYMPHPFQITQSTNKIHVAYSFTNTARTIHLDEVDGPPDDAWMGHSVGHWEGDTLVVNVTNFNDRSWFDRAGNYHSAMLKLTERFTKKSPDVIWYDVTIEDPEVYTRPWTIAMPLYRRAEPNMQLLEFRCNEFVEEFMYGSLRKEQLVRRWDGEMMSVEITRKIPEGDRFYEWYSK